MLLFWFHILQFLVIPVVLFLHWNSLVLSPFILFNQFLSGFTFSNIKITMLDVAGSWFMCEFQRMRRPMGWLERWWSELIQSHSVSWSVFPSGWQSLQLAEQVGGYSCRHKDGRGYIFRFPPLDICPCVGMQLRDCSGPSLDGLLVCNT